MIIIYNLSLLKYIREMTYEGKIPISKRKKIKDSLGVGGKGEFDKLDQGH